MKYLFKGLLAISLAFALVVSGCNVAQWITVAENDLPVILQIVVSILNIVDVRAVPAAQAAGVQAQTDLALAQQLVVQYKAGDKGTTLSEVNSALIAVNTDVAAILSAIHINNPAKQAAITAGIGVALSTLLAIESLIPVASGAKAASSAVKPPSARAVKNQFNSVIKLQYPQAVL
jgi:hypothetical protein